MSIRIYYIIWNFNFTINVFKIVKLIVIPYDDKSGYHCLDRSYYDEGRVEMCISEIRHI